MSGKGSGKKRNRAAQSEQHGYQQSPGDKASRPRGGKIGGAHLEETSERERILEKLRELDERRREQE